MIDVLSVAEILRAFSSDFKIYTPYISVRFSAGD
jgi:hypothetical protein